MLKLRLAFALAACAAVAACAQQAPPPPAATAAAVQPPPPPPPPPPAVTRYDGRYTGTATRTSRPSPQCTRATLPTTMTVRNGQASLTAGTGRAGPLEGAVTPDGALTLASANAQGNGRIVRNRFTGEVRGGECSYRVALSKRGR